MKKILIIGSSGGNLFNLGGASPRKLLDEILIQIKAAELEAEDLLFVTAGESMDTANDHTRASIYRLEKHQPVEIFNGNLKDANIEASKVDSYLADRIRNNEVDGIIAMSVDPEGTNLHTIKAAIETNIPIVGTGGTSMAMITSKGGNVIASSGTTGTTNRTRAVSFISCLCKHWDIKYNPQIGGSGHKEEIASGNVFKNINIRGIMISSLPGFIAMALVLALSKIPALEGLGEVTDLLLKALPVMMAVIAAKQVSELDEVSILSGVIAGVLSVNGGIIGGIIGGIGAGILVHYLFGKCIQWRFPMTTVNIVAGGISGLISGLIVFYFIGPVALKAGNLIKEIIELAVSFNPVLAGTVAGLLIWPAILGGVYHAAILPIVLLEMEKTGNSFLGAVDMVGLVMVSAGITLANILSPRDKGEAAVATPGFMINMGFGTFVEAAYPFMFSNKAVFIGAVLSAGLGGAMVGFFDVRGTAYVPSFTAPFMSNNPIGFIIAMAVPLLSALIITLIANKRATNKKKRDEATHNSPLKLESY
ncbi:PTS sugar transporter [Bacillus sp. M6-12]|uniref:PTS sugar transporter n=1 Tax=Bacillus sp. M6-12 TaxID=2054166 RepID=UPI002155616F|nr:PTS sugar transporter [Bacillus sp. M6-12]